MKAKRITRRKRAAITPGEAFQDRLGNLGEALMATHLVVDEAINRFQMMEHALSVFLVGEQPTPKRKRKPSRKPRTVKRAKRVHTTKTVKAVKKEVKTK
jgi:hypothetical protein